MGMQGLKAAAPAVNAADLHPLLTKSFGSLPLLHPHDGGAVVLRLDRPPRQVSLSADPVQPIKGGERFGFS